MKLLDISEPGKTEAYEAFGIDLGTTFSLVAKVDSDSGQVVVFTDSEGGSLLPSVVEYCKGTTKVGYDADFSKALHSVKRLIGRGVTLGISDEFCGMRVSSSDTGDVTLDVPGKGGVTPIEVSAEILRALSKLVENRTGEKIKHAVITVPAYFDEVSRKATRKAAELAGIEVLRILNEPTAAALAYRVEQKSDAGKLCIVYDLGGGTFDISVVKFHEGVLQVVATGGDTNLGGDDIDQGLAELILKKSGLHGKHSVSRNLMLETRSIKENMGTGEGAREYKFVVGGETVYCDISNAEFAEIVKGVIDRTIAILRDTMLDADIDASDVSDVILVGGSSRIPYVKSVLEEIFCGKVQDSIDPDKAVVVGAALQAFYLSNPAASKEKRVLLDVVPLSLSLEIMGGIVEVLIPRNTPVPAIVSQEFTTYVDGQTSISIHVCQGEREIVSENRSLVKFDIKVPPLPAGEVRIEVAFRVDMDGLLTVFVRDMATGNEKYVEINSMKDITQQEVERCVTGSIEHFEADMTAKGLSVIKGECQRILAVMKAMLEKGAIEDMDIPLVNDLITQECSIMRDCDIDKVRDFSDKLASVLTELRKKENDVLCSGGGSE